LARVIAVGDTFDALTTNRPYQQAYSAEEALKIIQNLAGKRLDPVCVAALMAVYERGEIRIQRYVIKRPVTGTPNATATAIPAAALPAPVTAATPTDTPDLERSRV
jgi:hypothetical protein